MCNVDMKLGCSTFNVVYFGMALLSEKTALVLFHSLEGMGQKLDCLFS